MTQHRRLKSSCLDLGISVHHPCVKGKEQICLQDDSCAENGFAYKSVQVFFMSQADVLGSRRDHKLRKAQLEPTLEALSDHCGDVIEPHPLHFSQ